jgi:hypothetical protein
MTRIVLVFVVIIFVFPSFGDTYIDFFSSGIDTTYWTIQFNDTLYKVDDTHGDVRFSRSSGGAHILNHIRLKFLPIVQGDFDIKVDFFNAYINRVSGSPGNQVQLNTHFGGQIFDVVRSDEASFGGHNYHVWINPPGEWRGAQANTDTNGTLRIIRVGSTVTGYFNSNSVFSDAYNQLDVVHISFSLQNNGTTDSTSVIFDNFSLSADSIVFNPTGITNPSQKITSFELRQNFPNPFNPSTAIEFSLPQAEFVTLRIYNLLGEEVSTLVSERLTAGKHSYDWDAGNHASGVFLYKLQAGDYVGVKKMILMK